MGSATFAILAAAAAPIQYAIAPPVPWGRIIISLLFCIGLAVAAIVFIRKRSGNGGVASLFPFIAAPHGQREMELLERLPLTGTSHLCLVRCGETRLVILISGSGAQLIDKLAAHETQGPST